MIFVLNKCMSCVKQKCHLHQQLSLASFFGIQGAGRNFLDIHRNSRCLQSPNCLYIFLFLFHVSSSSTKLSSVLCATMGVEATVDDSLNTANNVSLSLFFFLMGWKGDLAFERCQRDLLSLITDRWIYKGAEGDRRLASNYIFKECKMVVLSFPQCHCLGWCRCLKPSICHGESRMVYSIIPSSYHILKLPY